MQLTHIRKSDLNLLPALAALLEERSISKAAERHHLSQPAMSRVLQRLRGTFDDDLLVRTRQGIPSPHERGGFNKNFSSFCRVLTRSCAETASTPQPQRTGSDCAALITCHGCLRLHW
jgi:Bacterial regulatory helix-turn-helix protein, lysR family